MGNTYQSEVKRWDVISGLMESNGYKHLVNVDPADGRVASVVAANIEGITIEFDGKPTDTNIFLENTDGIKRPDKDTPIQIVYIEGHDAESVRKSVQEWYPKIMEGGIMAIGNFRHQEGIPVMRAVADLFPLYAVNVLPDNVAVVVK